MPDLKKLFTRIMLLLSSRIFLWLLIGFGIAAVAFFSMLLFPVLDNKSGRLVATTAPQLTVIAAPAVTATTCAQIVETQNPDAMADEVLRGDGFAAGEYVVIAGTSGAGLRIRTAPGTQAAIVYYGNDGETFRVVGGPVEADGFSWWYLEHPQQEVRGWAAQDYLIPFE